MKRIFILFVSLLSIALCHAEVYSVSHNFNTLYNSGGMTLTNSNKTGTVTTTDLHQVYTCYRTAAFGADCVYSSSTITLNLPANNDSVVITPAVSDLKGLQLACYDSNYAKRDLRVYIASEDGVWHHLTGDSISSENSSGIVSSFPIGNYKVKIVNRSTSSKIALVSVTYNLDPCPNCFEYTTEE